VKRIRDLKDLKGTTEKDGKERKNRKERFFSSEIFIISDFPKNSDISVVKNEK